jgi:hypothetical protein
MANIDLRENGEDVRRAWRASEGSHVPLALAAALAFHETYDRGRESMALRDYEDALDLMAAALSRLITVFRIDEHTRLPVPVRLDLGAGRFRNGASMYEQPRGRTALNPLVVLRAELPAAVDRVKAVGVPFKPADSS